MSQMGCGGRGGRDFAMRGGKGSSVNSHESWASCPESEVLATIPTVMFWSSRCEGISVRVGESIIRYFANTKKALDRALPPPATMSINDMPD